MNKLGTLIEWCKLHYRFSRENWFERDEDVEAIRRILEAVREDIRISDAGCELQRHVGRCAPWLEHGRDSCPDCPRLHHETVRAALESSDD